MKTNNKIELDQLDKSLPFKVPENYFENFAASMESQLQIQSPKSVSFYHRFRPYLFVAAALLCVLMVSFPVYKSLHKNTELRADADFKTYVANEVDEDMIVDYVSEVETE